MTKPVRIWLATMNEGKVREISAIVSPATVELVGPPAGWVAPEETGDTYRENALIKARALIERTGEPVLADDSGIEVDLLGGAPGVRSARFAGESATDEQNLRKLIEAIRDAYEPARSARYRCVAVFLTPAGDEMVAEETVEGMLITEPRGDGGFGYDPIFVPLEDPSRTMAELSPEEKDAISHRGKAFRALIPALRALTR